MLGLPTDGRGTDATALTDTLGCAAACAVTRTATTECEINDMNADARPTPDQIRRSLEDKHDGGFTSEASARDYDNALADHGYVIVHPDDVVEMRVASTPPDVDRQRYIGMIRGWNHCRAAIFGEAANTDTPTSEDDHYDR